MLPKARPLSSGLVFMFEGIDGAGKTTQLEHIRKTLEKAGWPVEQTRNLGGTPIGEALRKVMLSPLKRPVMTDFYISLAIQAPLLDLIDAARAEGKIVLMDRGPLSLAAYQVYGGGIDESVAMRQVEASMARIKPDAVFLYDIDPRTAMERKRHDSGKPDYFESKPRDYFRKVSEGYHDLAGRYSAAVIDAAQPVDDIYEKTLAIISRMLDAKA